MKPINETTKTLTSQEIFEKTDQNDDLMNKLNDEYEDQAFLDDENLRSIRMEHLNTINYITMVEEDMKINATKKQITIEAVQYDGTNATEVEDFVGSHNLVWNADRISIVTLEGNMTANTGDYIIKGVQGEFYPCKEDIFNETYDIG